MKLRNVGFYRSFLPFYVLRNPFNTKYHLSVIEKQKTVLPCVNFIGEKGALADGI